MALSEPIPIALPDSVSALMDVRLASTGEAMKCVQYAPGKYAAEVPRTAFPMWALAQLSAQRDGTFKPHLRVWHQHARVADDLGHRLGLPMDRNTIIRLIRAGFVKARKPAPGTYLVDLVSLWEHLEETEDPDFWTKARLEQYRQAIY